MDKTNDLIKRKDYNPNDYSQLKNAIDYSDRIIMLNKGKVVLDILPSEVTEEELNRIYNEKIEEENNLEVEKLARVNQVESFA